ncbi:hypothetical protein RSOL_520390, partial [Rhizoctonia solani AG-3 Rhs1AP]
MPNFNPYSDPKGKGKRVDWVNRKSRSRIGQWVDDTNENSADPSRQYDYAPGRHRDTSCLNSEDGEEEEKEEVEEEECDSSSGSKPSNDSFNLNHDIEAIGTTPRPKRKWAPDMKQEIHRVKRMKLEDAASCEALAPTGGSKPQAPPPFMPMNLDNTLDRMVRFLHAEFAKRKIILPPGVLPPSYPFVPQNQPAPPANHRTEPPANTLPLANHSPNPAGPFAPAQSEY